MKVLVHLIPVSESIGVVSALIDEPETPQAVLGLAHGAGANMEHRFLTRLAAELASRGVVTVRFNFPYTEKGRKRPDPPPIAKKQWRL